MHCSSAIFLLRVCLVHWSGQLCAVGGWRGRLDSRTVLDSIEFMDVRCSGGSSHDGALLTEREDLAAVFLNSKIYTIGLLLFR